MEKFLQDYLGIVSGNTIHSADLEHGIKHAIMENYSNMLSEQKAACGVTKYTCKLSDMRPVRKLEHDTEDSIPYCNRYAFQVNDSLVRYDKRYIVQSRELFGKPITQDQLAGEYSDTFDFNFLCFVDNYLVDSVKVALSDEYTTFILYVYEYQTEDGLMASRYDSFLAEDATVTIYITPKYQKDTLRINNATLAMLNHSIDFNRFNNPSCFDRNTLFFVNTNTDRSLKTNVSCTIVDGTVNIDNHTILDSVQYTLVAYSIPGLVVHSIIHDESWMQLHDYKSPIPKDNMMPLVMYTNQRAPKMSDIVITPYYPNIYNIRGTEGHKVKICFFFQESSWATYSNKLWLFYKYTPDILQKYIDHQIPEFVKEYEPVEIPYYKDLYSDTIHFPYTFAYKTMAYYEYLKEDPDLIYDYLNFKLKGKMRHYIYMEKLDLSTRIRMDNSREYIPSKNIDEEMYGNNFTKIVFTEPHYVFSLNKAVFGPDMVFRFYIDNLAVMPSDYYFQDDFDWYHVYIPTKMVTPTSILEIDKYPKYENEIIIPSNRLRMQSDNTAIIDFEKPADIPLIYMSNLHIYNGTTKKFIPPEEYEIYVNESRTKERIKLINRSGASIADTAEIKLLNPESFEGAGAIVISIKSHPRFYYNADANMYSQILAYDDVEIENSSVRPFIEGVFLNPNRFLFSGEKTNKFEDTVTMSINTNVGDRHFMIDILPCPNKLEYSVVGEYTDGTGFVDTGTSLSLPFSLKYYDVYVNGRKLNKSNVEIISPNKFFVKGIDSRKNLEVWLRGDAPTEFLFQDYNNTISDGIWNDMEGFKEAIIASKDILQDTLEDVLDSVEVNILAMWGDFINRYLRYQFINPNTQQLSPAMEALYPDFFDEYGIMWLNSNAPEATAFEFIDSNRRYEEMQNNQYRYGFVPLHIGSHEDALPGEYMCDPITGLPGIKDPVDNTILASGNLNRFVSQKNWFMHQLSLSNMADATIFQLEFNENTTAKKVVKNVNVLDEDNVSIIPDGKFTPNKIAFCLDFDVLEEGTNKVMRVSNYNPNITFNLSCTTLNGSNNTVNTFAVNASLDDANFVIVDMPTGHNVGGTTINSIIVKPLNADDAKIDECKIILHSILIAFVPTNVIML